VMTECKAMESRNSSRAERRRSLDRRRRDFAGFGGRERRIRGGRRRINMAEWIDDASSSASVVHRLLPADGHRFLSPLRVTARVESEFAYLEADEAEGSRKVGEILQRLKKAHRGQGQPGGNARVEHLQKVQNDAVHLRLGDDPSSEIDYLSVVVIPGEPLIVECESIEHAEAIEPLLKRCAKALGYSIIRNADAV
jgi:hypothetical protein